MNTKVLFYLKKFKEASDSDIPDLLIEAMKALPEYVVGYNFEDKQAFIKRDLRKVLASRIKDSGVSQTEIAELLGMHRTTLPDYLNEKRNIPYDNLCKLLALFDVPCIEAGELKDFLTWDESNEILFDDNGFFDLKVEGKEYSPEEVIEKYRVFKSTINK